MILFQPARLIQKYIFKHQENEDPFNKLPSDVMKLIFLLLQPHHVVCASLVSKKWYRFVNRHAVLQRDITIPKQIISRLPKNGRIIQTNQELMNCVIRYFSKLSIEESGKVICDLGANKQITFEVSCVWGFKKKEPLYLGMITGLNMDHLTHSSSDSMLKHGKPSTIRSSLKTDLLITYKHKHHYDYWAQVVFPSELEPVFLEEFKRVASKILRSIGLRNSLANTVGMMVLYPHHKIKYGDVIPEDQTRPNRIHYHSY